MQRRAVCVKALSDETWHASSTYMRRVLGRLPLKFRVRRPRPELPTEVIQAEDGVMQARCAAGGRKGGVARARPSAPNVLWGLELRRRRGATCARLPEKRTQFRQADVLCVEMAFVVCACSTKGLLRNDAVASSGTEVDSLKRMRLGITLALALPMLCP